MTDRERIGRGDLPHWYKREHQESALAHACAHHGMTAEQALDVFVQREAELLAALARKVSLETPPIVVSAEEWETFERERSKR